MGRLQRIYELTNKSLPSWNAAFAKIRGLGFPLDIFCSGKVRFARKIGEILPIIQPDNASDLTADLTNNNRTAIIDEPIPWLVTNSLLRFPLTGELVFAQDFTTDSMRVTFREPARVKHAAGERLELFGHPTSFESFAGTQVIPFQNGINASIISRIGDDLVVDGLTGITASSVGHLLTIAGATSPTNNGTFTIDSFISERRVRIRNASGVAPDANNGFISWVESLPIYSIDSSQPIYPGDDFFVDHALFTVVKSVIVGPIPPDITRFFLTLSRVLPPQVTGATVYLRAYPSYESPILPIPQIPLSSRGVGPGLIDWVSGPLFEDLLVEEIQNYQAFDNTLTNPIGDMIQIQKDYFESRLTIDPDSFLFFRPTRGEINWNGMQYVMFSDDRNEFHSFFDMVPNMPDSNLRSWTTQVTAHFPIKLVIELEDAARQIFLIPGGDVETTITIQRLKPVTRMNIAYHSEKPNTKVLMRGWTPFNVVQVGGIQHVLIAKTSGRYDWGSTGVFFKPFWLSLEYVKARADLRGRLDGGLLVL